MKKKAWNGASERTVTFCSWDDREVVRVERRGDHPAVRSTVTRAAAEAEMQGLTQHPAWDVAVLDASFDVPDAVVNAPHHTVCRAARRRAKQQQRRINVFVAVVERCTVQ